MQKIKGQRFKTHLLTSHSILTLLAQPCHIDESLIWTYLPNASTVGNLLMMAFLFAILITPKAKVTVTTTGRPEGGINKNDFG